MNRVQPKHAHAPSHGIFAKLFFLVAFVFTATVLLASYLSGTADVAHSIVPKPSLGWDVPCTSGAIPSFTETGFASLELAQSDASPSSEYLSMADSTIPESIVWESTQVRDLPQQIASELSLPIEDSTGSNQVVFAVLPSMDGARESVTAASFVASANRTAYRQNFLSSDESKAWGSLTEQEAREIEAQRGDHDAGNADDSDFTSVDSSSLVDRSETHDNDSESRAIVGQLEVGAGNNYDSQELREPSVFHDTGSNTVLDSNRKNGPQQRQQRQTRRSQQMANAEDPGWWVMEIHKPLLNGRQKLVMTLDEVVFTAIRNSPQVHILNAQPQIQKLRRNEAATEFDWSTFVDSRWNNQNDPIGSSLTQGNVNSGRFEQRDWTYEAGLTKKFTNGGDLRVGQNFGTIENNSNFLNPPDQGNSRLVLDYRQPLLRGAGRGFNTSQILLADLDFQSISNESRAELQAFLVNVVDAFWDIYLKRALLVQSRRSIYRAEELYRQLKSRNGIDVTNDQLLRAEAVIASRRSNLIKAEYDLVNSQDRLINLTVGPSAHNADFIELLPESLKLPMGINFQSSQLVEVAIHNRPEIQQAITRIKSGAIQNQIAMNQLRPKLDAVVSSYVSGLRDNKSFSRAFSDQFSTGEPSYALGFEFEVPIGNRAAKTRVERSQLEAAIFQQEFQKQVGDVVLDVRVAGREIERLNRENANNFYALQKASQELTLIRQRQQLNLDDNKTGSLYIEDLLGSQARLTAAENRLVISQTQQAVALVDLKRATGELFRSADQTYHSAQFDVSEEVRVPAPTTQGFGFPGAAIQP